MFLVVGQWQGSGSTRAMRLVDGAEAIRGDLPSAATRVVDVPLEAGDHLGTTVARCGSLIAVRDAQRRALVGVTEPVITIGGDCGVELGVAALAPDAAVIWFDAHADLNTPESSPSGAFHGMVLRTLLGDGDPTLVPERPLSAERIILAGVRALDAEEERYIAEAGIASVPVDALDPEALVAAVAATGAEDVYVHVDLDVLDPGELAGISHPEPFGASVAQLVACIRALRERFTLAGAGITEFAPASPSAAADDLPAILRIIGALTGPPPSTPSS